MNKKGGGEWTRVSVLTKSWFGSEGFRMRRWGWQLRDFVWRDEGDDSDNYGWIRRVGDIRHFTVEDRGSKHWRRMTGGPGPWATDERLSGSVLFFSDRLFRSTRNLFLFFFSSRRNLLTSFSFRPLYRYIYKNRKVIWQLQKWSIIRVV